MGYTHDNQRRARRDYFFAGRREDSGQQIRRRRVARQVRIPLAALIIDADGLVELAVLHQQFEGFGSVAVLAMASRSTVGVYCRVLTAISFTDGRETGLLRRAAVAHVGNRPVIVGDQHADGVGQIGDLAGLLTGLPEVAAHAVVGQLPAGVLDAAERRVGLGGMQALVQEAGPIVGLDGVQRRDDIVEVVGLERRRAARFRRGTACRNRRATSRPCSSGGSGRRPPARSACPRRNSPRCGAGSGNRCRLRRAPARRRRYLPADARCGRTCCPVRRPSRRAIRDSPPRVHRPLRGASTSPR